MSVQWSDSLPHCKEVHHSPPESICGFSGYAKKIQIAPLPVPGATPTDRIRPNPTESDRIRTNPTESDRIWQLDQIDRSYQKSKSDQIWPNPTKSDGQIRSDLVGVASGRGPKDGYNWNRACSPTYAPWGRVVGVRGTLRHFATCTSTGHLQRAQTQTPRELSVGRSWRCLPRVVGGGCGGR